MRRILVAAATAALLGGSLAFAPAVTESEPVTDHAITFTEDGSQTVEGAVVGGTNLLGGCTKDPNATCETILVTVEQLVADEDPDDVDFGAGELELSLDPQVPGADFDFTVFTTDETGASRGDEVASSGNPPACAQTCEALGNVPLLVVEDCGGADECATFSVATSEFLGTAHYLVEVRYFAAAGAWTMDAAYTRTDGRNADGTIGGNQSSEAPPADSVERFDVAMFGEFDTELPGDWGGGGDAAAVGSALGQDFDAAYLEYGDDTFTFTLAMTELLAAGGTPELTRYGWSFSYNGNAFELDGKFTNYSRGACDPTANSCPPPRNPGIGYFALRGNCTTSEAGNVTLCEELGGVTASFDPATGEIAIPIPATLLTDEVRACDTISGDSSFIGASIWAAPSAFVTSSAMPFDDVTMHTNLVVPHADPTLSC